MEKKSDPNPFPPPDRAFLDEADFALSTPDPWLGALMPIRRPTHTEICTPIKSSDWISVHYLYLGRVARNVSL